MDARYQADSRAANKNSKRLLYWWMCAMFDA
jgi:hypothetical protein